MWAETVQEVDAQLVHAEVELAERLDRVGMDEHALLVGDADDLGDGLDGPDLVVGVHDRDEGGPGGHGVAEKIEVDESGPVDRDIA